MTNSTIILSLLVTNLAQIDVTLPEVYANKELGVKAVRKEIGIVFSNQIARTTIIYKDSTNVHDVLLSSEVIGCELNLRNPPPQIGFTNMIIQGWKFGIPITNYYGL